MRRAITAVALGIPTLTVGFGMTTFRRMADLQTAIWIRSRASNNEKSLMGSGLTPTADCTQF